MFIEIFKELIVGLIAKISSRLLKLIYSQEKLCNDIDIDIKSSNGLSISLNRNIPNVVLYLKILNRSPYVDIEFDRAIVDIWLQQPFITLFLIKKTFLKRRAAAQEIHGDSFMHYAQVKYLCNHLNESKSDEYRTTLYIQAYFNSPYGNIEKSQRIETTIKVSGNFDIYLKSLKDNNK